MKLILAIDDQKKSKLGVKFLTKEKVKTIPSIVMLGESFKIHTDATAGYVYVLQKEDMLQDDWRESGFNLMQHLNNLNIESVDIEVPANCQEFLEGLVLGDYSFQKYKSEPKSNILNKIILYPNVLKDAHDEVIEQCIHRATNRANAQCFTRDMVNGTAEDMTSVTITNTIIDMFADVDNITVTKYDESELSKLEMNGHLAVNRSSPHPAMTVKLTYTPQGLRRSDFSKHVVLIGKGLTYDSGGLSIKPTDSMVNMKCDKAGAMTVLGIMKGLVEIGSPYYVTAYIALAENMINEHSYKPGDVLTMKNKKTVHVKNTDAEGRLVLFDNMVLAEEENPDFDEMYTFATLTGAALAAFGAEAAGMVGFADEMKDKIKTVGLKEGEIFCNAEFHKFMLDGVDDKLADLSNMGTKYQGCHKAGLFLTNALTEEGKKKYLHLDIAGPAFADKPFGTNQSGGTGFGVRTFLSYLMKW